MTFVHINLAYSPEATFSPNVQQCCGRPSSCLHLLRGEGDGCQRSRISVAYSSSSPDGHLLSHVHMGALRAEPYRAQRPDGAREPERGVLWAGLVKMRRLVVVRCSLLTGSLPRHSS